MSDSVEQTIVVKLTSRSFNAVYISINHIPGLSESGGGGIRFRWTSPERLSDPASGRRSTHVQCCQAAQTYGQGSIFSRNVYERKNEFTTALRRQFVHEEDHRVRRRQVLSAARAQQGPTTAPVATPASHTSHAKTSRLVCCEETRCLQNV